MTRKKPDLETAVQPSVRGGAQNPGLALRHGETGATRGDFLGPTLKSVCIRVLKQAHIYSGTDCGGNPKSLMSHFPRTQD